ncbi:MAG: hypothetical protein LBQ66_05330, partial [Planctomycetaceae bacterium]|nr:hypothetical protein [Planctomycetaceae bacterium]
EYGINKICETNEILPSTLFVYSVFFVWFVFSKKLVWYNEGGMPAFQSAPLRGKLMWYNEVLIPCILISGTKGSKHKKRNNQKNYQQDFLR